MSSYPLVKFVDSPSTAATVRYDCNDQAATPAKKVTDFDPGVPTLEGDPDAVGQQWGFRSPKIVHTIKGTKAQAMAALSAVSKELLRRTNWVLFQPSAAQQAVWFKTYRTGYEPIKLDRVFVRVDGGGTVALPDTWEITIPLVAEAFTYGARVNITTAQVIQGPADLTGPVRTAMRMVLPAIKGDAPTNLRVTITPADPADTSGIPAPSPSWLVACIAGKTAMSDPVVDIGTGDGLTAGPGTAAGAADATFFNGSNRTVTIGAGANLITRLSGNFPSVPAGRYKVALRYQVGVSNVIDQFPLFQLETAINSTLAAFTRVTGASVPVTVNLGTAGNVVRGWVDLGDFNLPTDLVVPTNTTDTLPGPGLAPYFRLNIGTSDGVAMNVVIDAFKLIPLDGVTVDRASTLKAAWNRGNPIQTTGGVTTIGTFDGDSEAFWATVSGSLFPSRPTLAGGFPVADPAAQQNLLVIMATMHGRPFSAATTTITSLNAQAAVDVSYHPRYLHVGDGT